MRRLGFRNRIEPVGDELHQIITNPSFAIGQRAFLVRTRSGNLLWDCISYIDDETVRAIEGLGGIDAIALSHPHFYSSMVEWSEAFGGVPVYVHNLDRTWVQRAHPKTIFWKGEKTSPLGGLEIVNLGGHFDGSSVLHLRTGAHGKGVLLSGDTIHVVMDRRWASFMYSYPNAIPLPARKVRSIASRIKPYKFANLYGGFEGGEIIGNADLAVQLSAERYVNRLR
jgi:glyoxylase-like metal-dependent hydrolase (beta-lactamase superfamily II)